ncbi:MAG: HAD family hydrolase [bacterium]|nr:HAD family hydrolase [bacterium]
MNEIRAVFFDLGGTLFSNHGIPKVCMPILEEAAHRLGLEGGVASIGRAFVDATRVTNERYVERSYYLHRSLFLESTDQLLELLGREKSSDFSEWFYRAQRGVMISQLELREDCLETLAELRSRGMRLCVVSNIDNDYLDPMMKNLKLDSHFDHWISSESARSCKPDPGIFELALQTVDCGPDEVLFVGDSRVHDIQGAHRVGIRSVLISEEGGTSHLDDETFDIQADHVIGQLSELLAIAAA